MKIVFKNIIRNFTRHPVTNVINLAGLAVSMAIVVILSVYCYGELTTDRFHANGDRVYLFKKSDQGFYTPGILRDNIDNKVPGLESVLRVIEFWERPVFQYNNSEPITSDLLFSDSDFFKLFTYKVREGSLSDALSDPFNVVITSSLSHILFGEEPALGKTIKMNNSKMLNVAAVIDEPSENSCFSFSAVTSMETRRIIVGKQQEEELRQWGWNSFQTFLLLEKGSDASSVLTSIQMMIPDDQREQYRNASLIPLDEVYFTGVRLFGTDYIRTGSRTKVLILVLVAILILLIAIVNFINITSSQWFDSIRQTGIKKVLGASKGSVFRSISLESFILFLAAFLLSLNIVPVIYPLIHNLTAISFNQKIIYNLGYLGLALAAILILSVMFSIIPAIRISASSAVDNLKKTAITERKSFRFKGILVTAQFTISLILIAFTIMVQKQVRFGTSGLGMNQENIIGIRLTEQLKRNRAVLRDVLESKPYVNDISFTEYFPGQTISNWGTQMILNGEKRQVKFDTFSADPDLFNMLGLQLDSGRFYSRDMLSDYRKVVVNEAFLRENKIDNPIGGQIITGMMGEPAYFSEIVGVVKDFHYKPFNQPVVALAIRYDSSAFYCLVNLKTSDFKNFYSAREDIKKEASLLSPAFPVSIEFMDVAVKDMYLSELQFRRTFSLFSGCAIILCCLGILAMSLSESRRRIKEIGIRKVNGARASDIIFMLNREFLMWVLIAFIISVPAAYYPMQQWLSGFVYKSPVSWWVFALAGLTVIVIALLTVSWQSWRASTRNPVDALRYE